MEADWADAAATGEGGPGRGGAASRNHKHYKWAAAWP